MRVFEVTLRFLVPNEDGDPAKWNWQDLTDHAHPITVVSATDLGAPRPEYVIVSADSMDDYDGPYEVDTQWVPEYETIDRTDHDALRKLADSCNRNFDGFYMVIDKAEFDRIRSERS